MVQNAERQTTHLMKLPAQLPRILPPTSATAKGSQMPPYKRTNPVPVKNFYDPLWSMMSTMQHMHQLSSYRNILYSCYSSLILLGCDNVYCCGRILMFWRSYHNTTCHHNPEELDLKLHHREDLKSYSDVIFHFPERNVLQSYILFKLTYHSRELQIQHWMALVKLPRNRIK